MAGPYFTSGKLLFNASKLALDVKCCCCNVLLIAVYNSNCAKDDNFDVDCNAFALGSIDNSQNNKCTGRLFYAVVDPINNPDLGPGPTRSNCDMQCGGPLGCICAGDDFQATVQFTFADVIADGTNSLTVTSTNNANNGNFGTMWVGCVSWNGTCYVLQHVLLDSSYGHAVGPPNHTTKFFDWPPVI